MRMHMDPIVWEPPWTWQEGEIPGYEFTDSPKRGDIVAVSGRCKDGGFLPTFAPWWAGLTVLEVHSDHIDLLTPDGREITMDLDRRQLTTHWAVYRPNEGSETT